MGRRPLLLLSAVCLVLPLAPSSATPAACTCGEGNACYHWLNAPVDPPDDPCSCGECAAARGSCPRRWPASWDTACGNSRLIPCFLRRHAASWRITCSEMLGGACACAGPHPDRCPECGEEGRERNAGDLDRVRTQLGIETKLLGADRRIMVLFSPHIYLVTDIPKIRITQQKGGFRWMDGHELAHVFLQRAEIAWRDFVAVFGDRMTYERPCAVFLLEKEATKKRVAVQYLGGWEAELLYGADARTISGGFGYNGLAISLEKYLDDDLMHFQMRHLLGHLFISCWVEGGGAVDILPKWMYAGAGHWLSRLPEKFRERAAFCSGEGFAVTDTGRKWPEKLRKIALDREAVPVQRILDERSFEGLSLEMHMRAWSWFDVFLREDRDRFLEFLALIRRGTDAREAMRGAFGAVPEEFDRRWRDRLAGLRPSVAATPAELDAADPGRPGAETRRDLRRETDPAILAARVRALPPVDDPATAATLLPLLDSPSDDVREAVVLLLSGSGDARVRAVLRTEGLGKLAGRPLAQVVRILGNLKDAEAAEAIRALAANPSWLVRAHAAGALGLLGGPVNLAVIEPLVGDGAPKVRVAAMDALARYGAAARARWRPVAAQLASSDWPVRSAAVDGLGALGARESVDALIDAMDREAGRLRHDVRETLKRVTGDDLGGDPRHWREWWEKEKGREGGDPAPARPSPADEEYGTPTYYGIPVRSSAVGFALDASASMTFRIGLDSEWLAKNGRDYPPVATKFDHAHAEILASLRSLPPGTRFNLYFFRSDAGAWKKEPVPATAANLDAADKAIAIYRPPDRLMAGGVYRTNYHEAFRLILGLAGGETPAGFRDTPDTVYFLTDGKPTLGDITDTESLLSWLREQNRFARVRIHVITFGKLESDPEFLRRLAGENGGRLVEVPPER